MEARSIDAVPRKIDRSNPYAVSAGLCVTHLLRVK